LDGTHFFYLKVKFAGMSVVKEMFSRKRILPLLLMAAILAYWFYNKPISLVEVEGVTFGSISYHIKYKDSEGRNFKTSIDSLLLVFNGALSHYIPDSELSKLNKSQEPQSYTSPFMLPVLQESKRIYDLSNGAYNPAIMPLVNVWGFGPDEGIAPDSTLIDSLLAFSDFRLVEFTYQKVWKKDPRVQLDFSASAKGYAVDVIGHFLLSKGIESFFVEIGGEVVCKGENAKKQPWRIGIINPESDLFDQSFIATVDVSDLAVATSANNFNYRVIDGVKYSHTIDPVTGYPITQSILSASIFAKECMTADALATACMVMGMEKAIAMIENMPDVEALLIYSDENGLIAHYVTDGIKQKVNFVKQD
jgi:thiamine biosynthesis lipoprotein